MFGSLAIARVFGITVRVHWMWLALLIFIALFWPHDPFATLINTLVLFGIVFLHELGHSLMARWFKIRVIDITLWPLGGMARMSEIPENSRIEALIALAGPAVNFALAAASVPVLIASGAMAYSEVAPRLTMSIADLALNFLWMNAAMGVFNLLPAFPMDGGRVLRALLGVFSDWVTATKRAVTVGKALAFLMVVAGFFVPGAQMLPLIGLFIWWQGSAELLGVRMRHGDLPGFAPRGPRPASFSTDAPAAPREPHPDDPSGARRPVDNPLERGRGPLSEDDIAKLESFRGRLRGPNDPAE